VHFEITATVSKRLALVST